MLNFSQVQKALKRWVGISPVIIRRMADQQGHAGMTFNSVVSCLEEMPSREAPVKVLECVILIRQLADEGRSINLNLIIEIRRETDFSLVLGALIKTVV